MNHDKNAIAFAKKMQQLQEAHAHALLVLAKDFNVNPIVLFDSAGDDFKIMSVAMEQRAVAPILDLLSVIKIIIKEEQN